MYLAFISSCAKCEKSSWYRGVALVRKLTGFYLPTTFLPTFCPKVAVTAVKTPELIVIWSELLCDTKKSFTMETGSKTFLVRILGICIGTYNTEL